MKSVLKILCALAMFSAPASADPVGEKMSYTLNKSRSHRLIKAGQVVHTVTEDQGDNFQTSMYCRFDVTLLGRKEGTGYMPFAKDAFEPQWIESLRAGNEYQGPGHKARHIGYGTARSARGTVFENCDKIRIYDIDTSNACVQALTASFAANGINVKAGDVEMTAYIKSGYPILGFVQLDLKLKNGSTTYDVGLDLVD